MQNNSFVSKFKLLPTALLSVAFRSLLSVVRAPLLLVAFAPLLFSACASQKKEEIPVIETKVNQGQVLNSNAQIGQNSNGALVYQEKSSVIQDLLNLENEVMMLQDEVYGTEKYKSKGLFGKVKACRKKRALKTGEMKYIPEKSIVLEEDQVKSGIESGSNQYINWTEEKISDRVKRFKDYKQKFVDVREELEEFLEKCEIALQVETQSNR